MQKEELNKLTSEDELMIEVLAKNRIDIARIRGVNSLYEQRRFRWKKIERLQILVRQTHQDDIYELELRSCNEIT